MRQYLLLYISLVVFALDQLSKAFISRLEPGESIVVIKNIFHISLVYNTGIAFGLCKGGALWFAALSLAVIAVILIGFVKHRKAYTLKRHIGLGLILGGAAGNFVDRVRFGSVVDFLDFRVWPVFNLADSAITVGVFLLALELFGHSHRAR